MEVRGDELGHRLNTFLRFEKRLDVDGAIQNSVEVLNVSDTFGFGDFEELIFKEILRAG